MGPAPFEPDHHGSAAFEDMAVPVPLAASMLGISPQTVARLITSGTLDCTRERHHRYVPLVSLFAYRRQLLAAHTPTRPAPEPTSISEAPCDVNEPAGPMLDDDALERASAEVPSTSTFPHPRTRTLLLRLASDPAPEGESSLADWIRAQDAAGTPVKEMARRAGRPRSTMQDWRKLLRAEQ